LPQVQLTHLVEGDSATESKQPQLETGSLDERRRRLVNDGEVVDLVLASAELLDNSDVLNQAPDGEYRDGESDRPRE